MNGKARRIIGTALIIVVGILLLGSGATKIAHVPQVVAQMNSNGFSGEKLALVGILEVVCALLFLIPATRSWGFLLVSSFLGGAIATHFQHGQPVFAPLIVLALLWLGTWLRHTAILWKATAGEQPAGENGPFARWSSQP